MGELTDCRDAAHAWASGWAAAWVAADTEAVARLYAYDAVFQSHPFRDAQKPAAYAAWAFADQAAAVCRFGEPFVAGDRAVVEWWAVVTDHEGRDETLAGASMLQFGPDGLVTEQRDVWAASEGRLELPHWAR